MYASLYLAGPLFIRNLGESLQTKMRVSRTMVGKTDDAVCHLHAVRPTLETLRFAVDPRKMPSASNNCQFITNDPLMWAGEISAAKTGTMLAFVPIPIPKMTRHANSCCHV